MADSKSTHQIEINATDKASAVVRGVEASFAKLGAFIGGAAVAGAFVKATEAAIGFEQGLAKTATLLPKANRDMTQFAKGIEAIRGKGLGGSLKELTDGLYETVSAGVPAGKAVMFLETASKAAKAGFTDMRTAVDGLTTVLNAYGLATEDVNKVADVLFVTQNRGKTTFGEMAGTLGQLLPIASSVGAKFEEMAAAISTLTIQGIPTAVAITGLRATIAAFIEKGDAGKIALLGFAGALKDLELQTGGNQKKMQDYLGRVEALNTVVALTGKNSKQFASDLEATANAAGAAEDALAAFTDNTAGKFDILLGKLEVFGVKFGEKFANGILSDSNMTEVTKDADHMADIFLWLADKAGIAARSIANEFTSGLRTAREVWESWKASIAKDPLFNANSPYASGGSYWQGASTSGSVTGSAGMGQFGSAFQNTLASSGSMFTIAEQTVIAGGAKVENALSIVAERLANWGPTISGSRFGAGRGIISRLGSAGRGGIGMQAGRGGGRLSGGLFDTQFNASTVPSFDSGFGPAGQQVDKLNEQIQNIAPAFQYAMSAVTNTIVQGAINGALKIKDVFNALRNAILQILADIAARAATAGLLSLIFPTIGFGGALRGLSTGNFTGGISSVRPAPVGANPNLGVSGFGGGGVHNHYYIQGSLVTEQELTKRVMNNGVKQARRGSNALSGHIG